MTISKLAFAETGDIHLGHSNTSTAHVIASLEDAFPDNEVTGKLDVIFLAGDIFDRLMTTNDPNYVLIQLWVVRFLSMCSRRKISVRVLEGTPSHDWKQSVLFETMRYVGNIDVDLIYVRDLWIERHPLGFTVLYVPDEWRPDPNDTYMEVCQKLREEGLEKVDLAIMHGNFEYQLPAGAHAPCHNAERYLDLVEHYIFINHIHKHSQYKRIYASGSLDRLAHGEENPKGHLRVTIDQVNGDSILFVENKTAQTYLTIDCSDLTLEESFKRLEVVKDYPEDSHVRVMALRDDPILVNMELLRSSYPHIRWGTKAQVADNPQSSLLMDLRSQYEEIQLTQTNIPELLEKRMVQQNYPPELIQRSLQLLAEAL